MVKILIHGALGRMGKKVAEAIKSFPQAEVFCGIDVANDDLGYKVYSSFEQLVEKPDVIIDFSSPVCTPTILDYAVKNNVPAVLCSTGYSASDIEKINRASEKVAIFRSANMSFGANAIISLVKKAAKLLNEFDVEIIEKHHNQKVDAPSGTALMLADAVKEVQPDKFYIYGREGKVGKRNDKEIGIHAIRGGNIVGEHDVIFAGENETITVSHTATDRSVFAFGAVRAAIYIADKPAGLYDMTKLIGND